ncbi:MAG: hypothetical protein J1E06_07165 [Acutalibacter sp.]|nr:hypothetical protein [Acutalibacter sp.]
MRFSNLPLPEIVDLQERKKEIIFSLISGKNHRKFTWHFSLIYGILVLYIVRVKSSIFQVDGIVTVSDESCKITAKQRPGCQLYFTQQFASRQRRPRRAKKLRLCILFENGLTTA